MGYNLDYQFTGRTTGGLAVEAGDISYVETSSTAQYIHLPTHLSHIICGLAFADGTVNDTQIGRASPRIGEISAGVICFSTSDTTMTAGTFDKWTYIAVGW